ncbi:hypothetical protein L484_020709 [Morus notabilis]|uniref:Uncharacterized protein n=1 Tax=Morus notabilis TaxID=981085 RepID=W9QM07_9ROSA|nr:hypothetical protein L484_020709 [Morus notabilis]
MATAQNYSKPCLVSRKSNITIKDITTIRTIIRRETICNFRDLRLPRQNSLMIVEQVVDHLQLCLQQ